MCVYVCILSCINRFLESNPNLPNAKYGSKSLHYTWYTENGDSLGEVPSVCFDWRYNPEIFYGIIYRKGRVQTSTPIAIKPYRRVRNGPNQRQNQTKAKFGKTKAPSFKKTDHTLGHSTHGDSMNTEYGIRHQNTTSPPTMFLYYRSRIQCTLYTPHQTQLHLNLNPQRL